MGTAQSAPWQSAQLDSRRRAASQPVSEMKRVEDGRLIQSSSQTKVETTSSKAAASVGSSNPASGGV